MYICTEHYLQTAPNLDYLKKIDFYKILFKVPQLRVRPPISLALVRTSCEAFVKRHEGT